MRYEPHAINDAARAEFVKVAQGGQMGSSTGDAPRTVANAIGMLGRLNERMAANLALLAKVSDSIGGPRPVGGAKMVGDDRPVSGAVGFLHVNLETAHQQASEMEDLLGSISRALG
jgi:hypothetical protein